MSKKECAPFSSTPPPDVVEAIESSSLDVVPRLSGDFDYIHYFTKTQAQLEGNLARLQGHLKPTGMLWVSWPKGKKQQSNLTLPLVIKTGYDTVSSKVNV